MSARTATRMGFRRSGFKSRRLASTRATDVRSDPDSGHGANGSGVASSGAFGPLLALSFLDRHHVLADRRDGPALRFGVVLGILAGATVTVMLSVQMGNNMMRAEQLSQADTEAAPEVARLSLNLDTFPRGRAFAGSVDLGPLLAVWLMAVYV